MNSILKMKRVRFLVVFINMTVAMAMAMSKTVSKNTTSSRNYRGLFSHRYSSFQNRLTFQWYFPD